MTSHQYEIYDLLWLLNILIIWILNYFAVVILIINPCLFNDFYKRLAEYFSGVKNFRAKRIQKNILNNLRLVPNKDKILDANLDRIVTNIDLDK
jgi:hypothetical protein